MERDELAAWLRLALTRGVGNSAARKLLAALGSPQAIFEQSPAAVQQVVSAANARALATEPAQLSAKLQATLDWLDGGEGSDNGGSRTRTGNARRVITLGDPLYPQPLLATDDPPLMLYMTGNASFYAEFASKTIANDISIVGSRNPTPQGLENARNFAKSFASEGLNIVSGLALGIDGAAHLGALEAAQGDADARGAQQPCRVGGTIAIVGTGLDRIYPKQHYELAHRIVQHGAILSEFHIGTPPLSENFPQRNRIISALTQGTLVVEAAIQSGSLITARFAAEQGKDVFAIPGSIHSAQSKGCHFLIKQGAKLVESAQDVLEELKYPIATKSVAVYAISTAHSTNINNSPSAHTSNDDAANNLLDALGYDPVSLDALIARTGINAPTLQARLMELELDNDVVRLPGGLFQRYAAG